MAIIPYFCRANSTLKGITQFLRGVLISLNFNDHPPWKISFLEYLP